MNFFVLDSPDINSTVSLPLNGSSVLTWLSTSASAVYKDYIQNVACSMNKSLATYGFCVQDTILSQSPLLGQLTVKSSTDYQTAFRTLCNTKKKSLISSYINYFFHSSKQWSKSFISNTNIN